MKLRNMIYSNSQNQFFLIRLIFIFYSLVMFNVDFIKEFMALIFSYNITDNHLFLEILIEYNIIKIIYVNLYKILHINIKNLID